MAGDLFQNESDCSSTSNNNSSIDGAEKALCDVLGMPSFQAMTLVVDEDDPHEPADEHAANDCTSNANLSSHWLDTILPQRSDEYIAEIVDRYQLQRVYRETSVCTLPPELSIPAQLLRRWTEEVVWATPEQYPQVLRTYETVAVAVSPQHEPDSGERRHRRVLTRLENLNSHPGWYALCNDYVRRCVRAIIFGPQKQQPQQQTEADDDLHVFKTKLNLKPPGTCGFAPHVDTPSLRTALGDAGPKEFVTVMLAIDDTTEQNGCLRLAALPPSSSAPHPHSQIQEPWNEATVPVVQPIGDGNPDAEGRAGAIPLEVADSNQMTFENLTCPGGTLALFGGWVPHRSAANRSPCTPRRALFVTYSMGGDFHDLYYERMAQRRWAWKERQQQQQQAKSTSLEGLDEEELVALSTIPRI